MTKPTTHLLFAFILYTAAAVGALGQQASPTPPKDAQENDVVKITTKQVQVDVVVTDKDGNQVTDLTAGDFEIKQDGKPQKITGVTYIGGSAQAGTPAVAAEVKKVEKIEKGAIPPPAVKVRPSESSRILTFVVDDGNCKASQTGMTAAREGLQKFINQQMLPTDLVAIYRTRAGSSVFQQYTSDKAQLLKAAEKVRWIPAYGSCGGSGADIFEPSRVNTIDKATPTGTETIQIESPDQRASREAGEDLSRNSQVVGSVGVLRYVIRGLDRVPGRKIVFFMSDGLTFMSRTRENLSALDVLRDVTELANRSSVVINTLDIRGVFDSSIIEAQDEVSTRAAYDATSTLTNDRESDVQRSRDGMRFLADETGGKFEKDQNFLDVPIGKLLKREKGFYLVAYEPDGETFKGKKFNNIDVKVTRPNLNVVTRSGFVGVPDEAIKPKKKSGDSELYEAIIAPIPKPGLNVQLSAYFATSPAGENIVRGMFHLDGSEITFLDDPSGMKKAVFDVVAVTMDEKNGVVDEFTRSHNFKIEAAAIPTILKNGLIYSTDVPVKKPGTYNFRVAVRDGNGHNIGSASQLVQIPDLKKRRMFLSGLTMAGTDAAGKFTVPAPVTAENAIAVPRSGAVPGIRRFSKGSIVAYMYTFYNAPIDPATGKPNYSVQVKLFHDATMILESKPQMAAPEKQDDWSRITDYAYMRLNKDSEPGDYALQVIIKDLSPNGKNQSVSQWIDFEVE